MVVGLTLLVGLASANGSPDEGRLTLATVSMLLSQLSIGWSNDYLDRNRDALHQPEKPLPSGLVAPGLLLVLTPVAFAASASAAATLGVDVLALLIAGTACGFAYNLFLKDTPLSWTAYVAAFALLPPFVWTALNEYRGEFLWLYALGAPLAVAAHVANTLPDIEADAAAGGGGLVVRLGRFRALVLLFACLVAPAAIVALSLIWVEYTAPTLALSLLAYGALVIAAALAYRSEPFAAGAARAFRIIGPAAILLVTGWLAAL